MIAVIGEYLSQSDREFSWTDQSGVRQTGTEHSVKLFDADRDDVVYVSLGRDFDRNALANVQRGDAIAFACFARGSGKRVYFTATHMVNDLLGKSVKAA